MAEKSLALHFSHCCDLSKVIGGGGVEEPQLARDPGHQSLRGELGVEASEKRSRVERIQRSLTRRTMITVTEASEPASWGPERRGIVGKQQLGARRSDLAHQVATQRIVVRELAVGVPEKSGPGASQGRSRTFRFSPALCGELRAAAPAPGSVGADHDSDVRSLLRKAC